MKGFPEEIALELKLEEWTGACPVGRGIPS